MRCGYPCPYGHVAEWLRSGLQNRLPRFNSGRGLQHLRNWIPTLCSEYCEIPPEAFAQTVIVAKGGGSDVHSVSPARMGTDWVNRCCCRGGRPSIVPMSRTGTADFPRRHLYRCTMVGFAPRFFDADESRENSQNEQRKPHLWLLNSLPRGNPNFHNLFPVRASRSRPLSKRDRLCYMRASIAPSRLFPGSSAVEQPAVNRLVAGSNPARGATARFELWFLMIFSVFCQTSRRV